MCLVPTGQCKYVSKSSKTFVSANFPAADFFAPTAAYDRRIGAYQRCLRFHSSTANRYPLHLVTGPAVAGYLDELPAWSNQQMSEDTRLRRVKPENILYVTRPDDQYQFQLGDFDLCNRVVSANTSVGSPLYMAPEMFQRGEQTHKVDVWSLFVTMLWTLDVAGFRQKCKHFKATGEVHKTVLSAASNEGAFSKIQEMATLNPDDRASAAQMLIKSFNGVGLSTPWSQVPGLSNSPAIPPGKPPAAAPPISTTRIVQQKWKDLQKKVNPMVAKGQYRVEKPYHVLHAQSPRRAFYPVPKRQMTQTVALPTVVEHHVFGSFPDDNDTTEERRSTPQERLCTV